jgi:hypothetical protein
MGITEVTLPGNRSNWSGWRACDGIGGGREDHSATDRFIDQPPAGLGNIIPAIVLHQKIPLLQSLPSIPGQHIYVVLDPRWLNSELHDHQ